ncbi:16S rRNA (guanine(527)-N(7))-methyltransferase RsmG [Caulobacter sp. S45]|uniref:16S rRNA (guanine(527)-N(7))-methyltransferase RsmG n=1 Tax=Caulobacter sp. S45 TaxID=1641861 RepID=UPI0020C68604|nr:16S rRNA (guanine(527)-N(7))-methyltransferase RsmG [Caulobacter sp. S45]
MSLSPLGSDIQQGSAAAFADAYGGTDSQIADLRFFYDLLEDWGQRMNLVGPSVRSDFWLRHVFDSAQLLHVEQAALRWADVGAGAGFPGVVLAILLKGRTGAQVHLIESMAKRAAFLSHVVRTLSLPASIHHVRAESCPAPKGLEIVTARACAPCSRLFEYTAHFMRAGAKGLFLKGRGVEQELTDARRTWTFTSELIPSLSDPTGRIVRVERLKPRG